MKYDSKLKRRGKGNPNWKGGRNPDSHGYYRIWIDENDPLYPMARKDGYILEHRLIMARHLDRCLAREEVVHHKNGIRTDNRLTNLKILTEKVHPLSYKIAYAEGFQAGLNTRNRQLKKQIKLLQLRLEELEK